MVIDVISIALPPSTLISYERQAEHRCGISPALRTTPQAPHVIVTGSTSITRFAPSAIVPWQQASKAVCSADRTTCRMAPIRHRTVRTRVAS